VAWRLTDLSRGRALHALQIGSRWEGRAVWSLFPDGADQPVLIVKVDHKKRSQQWLRQEHKALLALSGQPQLRGSVPEPVALFADGRRLALTQTAVPGTPLSVLARQRARPSPRACAVEHRLVLDWLACLHGDIASAPSHRVDSAQVVERSCSCSCRSWPGTVTSARATACSATGGSASSTGKAASAPARLPPT
jgi:hypothetical protein